jgi:2-polyprenyl-6-methoxyphenol hydroxylase-like FAD-dependent oxidoreductase
MAATREVQCCIAGGGPAGLMLGLLLARVGVKVLVLEKHADFLRDFRGDTIHPSTLEVMHELGLLDGLLKLPHQKVPRLTAQFGDESVPLADFSGVAARCPYIAMMPQWDFLNFLAGEARRSPSFELMMQAEATDLISENGQVIGASATTPQGQLDVRCHLVVGADGRSSVLRAKSGLKVEDLGAPIDALWFRLPRRSSDTDETQGRFDQGRIFVMLNRGDYWQCAYVIAKGTFEKIKRDGLDAFRSALGKLLPLEAARANEVTSMDDLKLLTVQVNRLTTWHKPGLLFIGDAAHAMSPVGGVGINLAVQDAVAAANVLAKPLLAGAIDETLLAAVQKRRFFPTRATQAMQVLVQNRIIAPALAGRKDARPLRPPFVFRLFQRFPYLRRFPARMIGLGVRPEHVAPFIQVAKG